MRKSWPVIVCFLVAMALAGCRLSSSSPRTKPVFNRIPSFPESLKGVVKQEEENKNSIKVTATKETSNSAYEMLDQIGNNYDNWVNDLNNGLLKSILEITPSNKGFGFSRDIFCSVVYEEVNLPPYTVKISFHDRDNGKLHAVYMRNDDNSKYTLIVKDDNYHKPYEEDGESKYEKEIRQLVYEKEGSLVHVRAFYNRSRVNDMNDIVEIWEEKNTKEIKCVRVYGLKSQEDQIRISFSAVVDLATEEEYTTARIFSNINDERMFKEDLQQSPSFLNKKDKLVAVKEPVPKGYPSPRAVLEVHQKGVDPDFVAQASIDEEKLTSSLTP
ncbi:MAG TPA: hypothetical protein VIL83_00655 [Capillibacterium sp.]